MIDLGPESTFRGLPLTAEQDAEVRHYIKLQMQRHLPWDTPELDAMLKEMIRPPEVTDGGPEVEADEARAAAERASASIDDALEPDEASEEWHAAIESENMKHPRE
ncbi:hypothetical protein M3A49_07400 [Paraburkholderia sp. CNPSo 3076]|uniref:hypothetical protein n=1 Tax=Paraburkholderia sp. CNPSo 3076 TaxID=2940936 RepID=UPI002252326A|nr:hypothetical protein [Paraburkholderia sp. CNPSo 3076]MCX5539322.1 hypothetical protein [Paraburkholderia sp. CNPSo 3076]